MRKKYVLKKKYVTFLLIYFVLFTSYFSILTLSKFASTSKKAVTSTIAKWEVYTDTSENESDTLNMVIGNTQESYNLRITSTSDVKAIYSIVLYNVPDVVEVKLDDSDIIYKSSNNMITFKDVGYINANDDEKTKNHILTFYTPLDSDVITDSEINIDVFFDQANVIEN